VPAQLIGQSPQGLTERHSKRKKALDELELAEYDEWEGKIPDLTSATFACFASVDFRTARKTIAALSLKRSFAAVSISCTFVSSKRDLKQLDAPGF
jgi:hypothetical protein